MRDDLRPAAFLIAPLLVLAVIGPFVAGDPNMMPDLGAGVLRPPSAAHWLGTDAFSRDVFARLAHGTRWTLRIALTGVALAAALGLAIGLAAGNEGASGRALRRVIDLALALPRMVVLLIAFATLGLLPWTGIALLLGLTGWPPLARLVRGEALRLRHAPFALASRALGATPWRLLRREILPGTLPTLLVAASLGLADAMLLEAGLSFLGLIVRPPQASLGGMLLEARDHLAAAPWLLFAPGAVLVLATSAATLFGDALRRAPLSGSR